MSPRLLLKNFVLSLKKYITLKIRKENENEKNYNLTFCRFIIKQTRKLFTAIKIKKKIQRISFVLNLYIRAYNLFFYFSFVFNS